MRDQLILTQGDTAHDWYMLRKQDRVCHCDHVHIFAAFLKRSVFNIFLVLFFAEILVTGLLVKQFLIKLTVFTLFFHIHDWLDRLLVFYLYRFFDLLLFHLDLLILVWLIVRLLG